MLAVTASVGPFVDVEVAQTMTASGAVVLDARGRAATRPFIAGARLVDWRDIRDGWLRTGRLAEPEDLRRYFERRGVSRDRPVLVYGAMGDGWGEEGRIWWTLRYLGHEKSHILNGTARTWASAGGAVATKPSRAERPGHFPLRLQSRLRADWRSVNRARQRPNATIIDVRTRQEYDGATPYWSSRGGHVPGAIWLHWKTLIGADGRLLSNEAIHRRLRAVGADPTRPVITYCTGGVRSAFTLAVLRQAGFTDVLNYDGSWWDWSQRGLPVE